jgi:hypothetical protein
MVNASVTQGGKARSAVLGLMNARYLIAMVMVAVTMGSVRVPVDTWGSSVRKVSFAHSEVHTYSYTAIVCLRSSLHFILICWKRKVCACYFVLCFGETKNTNLGGVF